jgi:hypothetical protein
MRVVPAVRSLRRRKMYQAIREATIAAARSERLRIVQVSLQRSHVHMIVEAENAKALAQGMQALRSRPPGTSTACSATASSDGAARCLPIDITSR